MRVCNQAMSYNREWDPDGLGVMPMGKLDE